MKLQTNWSLEPVYSYVEPTNQSAPPTEARRILPPSNPAPQKLKMELTFLWISILHQLPQSWGPSTASHNPGGSVRGVSTRTDTTLEGENSHQTRAQSLNSDSMKILYYNTKSLQLIPKVDELYKDPM